MLGALESGIDIEKRISDIYKRCRSAEDIQQAFDQLQRDLDEQISTTLQEARKVAAQKKVNELGRCSFSAWWASTPRAAFAFFRRQQPIPDTRAFRFRNARR